MSEILSKIYAEFAAGQREYDCGTIRHAADSFPEPMRVAPTATYTARDGSSGISYYSTHDNVPTVTPSGFSIIDTRTAKIVFALPSGVTISPGDFLYTNLTLDAEIYG